MRVLAEPPCVCAALEWTLLDFDQNGRLPGGERCSTACLLKDADENVASIQPYSPWAFSSTAILVD